MKKLFFLVVSLMWLSVVNAQYCGNSGSGICTPAASLPQPGLFPQSTSLAPFVNGVSASSVIQIKNFDSITYSSFHLRVNSLKIDSIQNLPAGLCWATNKSNNTFSNQEIGCILISGTTCAAPGQYKLKIIVDADLSSVGTATGIDAATAGLNYFIRVNNAGDASIAVDGSQTGSNAFIPYGYSSICSAASFALTTTAIDITCNGANDGIITVTPNGGAAPYSYELNNNGFQAGGNFTGLGPGIYTVTVIDNNGDTAIAHAVIHEPTALNVTGSVVNASGTGAADGGVILTITGGVPPYAHNWSNGTYGQNLGNVLYGPYSVTVTDAGHCTTVKNFYVDTVAVSGLYVYISSNQGCSGGAVLLTANVIGNTGNITYQWSNSGGAQTNLVSSSNTYRVTVTDASTSATASASIAITVNSALQFTLRIDTVDCYGNSTGRLTVFLSGGVPPYLYQLDNNPPQTSNVITGIPAGIHFVSVFDTINCSTGTQFTMVQPAAPLTINGSSTQASSSVSHDAAITINPTGGSAGYTYRWNDAVTTQNRTGLSIGTYSVTVTDAHGCTAERSFLIACPLSATYSVSNITCFGAGNGSITVNASCGTAPYQYRLNNGTYQSGNVFNNLGPGNYSITVKDASLNTTQIVVPVTQPARLIVNYAVTNADSVTAHDGSIRVNPGGGTAPYTFLWNDNDTSQNRTGLAIGFYSITITDGNGCTASATMVVSTGTVATNLNLSMDTIIGVTGQQVGVYVMVRNFKNIRTIQGSIVFDSTKITYVQPQLFGIPGLTVSNFSATGSSISYSWTDSIPNHGVYLPDSTIIFQLLFNVIGTQGQFSALNFTNTPTPQIYRDSANNLLPVALFPGRVNINTLANVSGKVTTPLGVPLHSVIVSDIPVPGTPLFYSVDSPYTDTSGHYALDFPLGSSARIYAEKSNDSAITNGVTTADLVLIKRHILARALLSTPYEIIAAAVDGQPRITDNDIFLIQELILGTTRSFPSGRLWTFMPASWTFNNPQQPFTPQIPPFLEVDNIVHSFTNENIYGIKLGDVNNSWDPTLKSLPDSVEFCFGSGSVARFDSIVIPVTTRNFNKISGFQFTVQWDSTALNFMQILDGQLHLFNSYTNANYGLHFINGGALTISWVEAIANWKTVPDDSVLFYIKFRGKGYTNQVTTVAINPVGYAPVEVLDSAVIAQPYSIGCAGTITVLAPVGINELRNNINISVMPNPFAKGTDLIFTNTTSCEVKLEVTNVNGQLAEKHVYQLQSGEQKLHFGDNLPAGMYFATLSTPDGRATLKVVSTGNK